jgi:hypothetical protein
MTVPLLMSAAGVLFAVALLCARLQKRSKRDRILRRLMEQ